MYSYANNYYMYINSLSEIWNLLAQFIAIENKVICHVCKLYWNAEFKGA